MRINFIVPQTSARYYTKIRQGRLMYNNYQFSYLRMMLREYVQDPRIAHNARRELVETFQNALPTSARGVIP